MRYTTTRWAVTAAAIVTVSAAALTGCSNNDDSDSSKSSPSASKSADPVQVAPGDKSASPSASETEGNGKDAAKTHEELKSTGISDEDTKAIEDYLNIRENAESKQYKNHDEWADALRKVTTDEGFSQIEKRYGPEDSSGEKIIAQQKGYTVEAKVAECGTNNAYQKEGQTGVKCALSDQVKVDGKDVSPSEVDHMWTYFGSRPSVTIVVEHGKVAADYTGMAS